MKIKVMIIIQYYRDGSPWTLKEVENPKWEQIETAIRAMDNYCFPIVQLNRTIDLDDENLFNIIGGNGRWALFHQMGDWEYTDDSGDETEVRLWDSDQGYMCKEKNVIKDMNILLKYVRVYYETASYKKLKEI